MCTAVYSNIEEALFTWFKQAKCEVCWCHEEDWNTVLVCANMSGTEKLPLLVIGRFAKPRCFQNTRSGSV